MKSHEKFMFQENMALSFSLFGQAKFSSLCITLKTKDFYFLKIVCVSVY